MTNAVSSPIPNSVFGDDDDDAIDIDIFGEGESPEKLAQELAAYQMQLQTVFSQSVKDGGPGSVIELIHMQMKEQKIGIRELASLTGTKRVKLQRMLDGTLDFSIDVLKKLLDVLMPEGADQKGK
jgi:hypothetical protein